MERNIKHLLFKEKKFWNKTLRSLIGRVQAFNLKEAGMNDLINILAARTRIPQDWKNYITVFSGTVIRNEETGRFEVPALLWDGDWKIKKVALGCHLKKIFFEEKSFRVAYWESAWKRKLQIVLWRFNKAATENERFRLLHPEIYQNDPVLN